jgi:uncharacterized protein (DUF2141 family)
MTALARWLLITLAAPAHAQEPEAPCVPLRIEGLRSASGVVHVAVFDDAESYVRSREDRAHFLVPAVAGSLDTQLCGLGAARVAVAVFHDENLNTELDTVAGIPREGFGFSRNPSLWRGKPRFDEVAVVLDDESLVIELIYLF